MERRDVGLSVGTFSMSPITGRRTPDVRTRGWSLISGATAGESAGDRPGHHQVLAQVHPPSGAEGLGLVGVSEKLHLWDGQLLVIILTSLLPTSCLCLPPTEKYLSFQGQQLLTNCPSANVSRGVNN